MKFSIPSHLSYETIDGETIIINLDKGHYYSLEKSASTIWQHIELGASMTQIINRFKRQFKQDASKIETEIPHFLDALKNVGLIEETTLAPEDFPYSFEDTTYTTPFFNVYTDMEDLLLLDPIHETDECGWPHQLVNETVKL